MTEFCAAATGLGSGAVVLLIADASHNFTDGLAVGVAHCVRYLLLLASMSLRVGGWLVVPSNSPRTLAVFLPISLALAVPFFSA